MQLRSLLAVGLTATILATTSPVRAQEVQRRGAPAPMIVESAPDVLALTSEVLQSHTRELPLSVRSPLASTSSTFTEVRLSRGAKTAIIVGAIVVGVLIIVGVVAIGKPGKHL